MVADQLCNVGDRVGHDYNSFPFWVHGCGTARRESRESRGVDVVLREYRSETLPGEAAARTALTPCGSVQYWKAPNLRRIGADRGLSILKVVELFQRSLPSSAVPRIVLKQPRKRCGNPQRWFTIS